MWGNKTSEILGSRLDQIKGENQGFITKDEFSFNDVEYDSNEQATEPDFLFYLIACGVFLCTFLFSIHYFGLLDSGLDVPPSKVTTYYKLIPEESLVKEAFEKKVYEICAPVPDSDSLVHAFKEHISKGTSAIKSLSLIPNASFHKIRKDYLICSMRNELKRFCYSPYREQLAKQLKVFILQKRFVIERYNSFIKTPQGQMYSRVVKTFKDSEMSTPGLPKKLLANKSLDPELGSAFNELMSRGYITKADFGWFDFNFPNELEPFVSSEISPLNECE